MAAEERFELRYEIHGLALDVETGDAALARSLADRLYAFASPAAGGPPDLSIRLERVERVAETLAAEVEALPVVATPALGEDFPLPPASASLRVRRGGTRFGLDLGDGVGLALCDTAAGRAWGEFTDGRVLRYLFWHLLPYLLCARGMLLLHASACCLGERAVLVAGPSGSGKTTLALGLLRRGHRLLGDDVVVIARGEDGPRLLSFPTPVRVLPETIALLPYLSSLPGLRSSEIPGDPKQVFRAEATGPEAVARSARPAAIVFPGVLPGARAALAPVVKARVLSDLVSWAVSAIDRAGARSSFDLLASLVERCACYRLIMGGGLDEALALVAGLIEREGGGPGVKVP